jgi:hypothetical protein
MGSQRRGALFASVFAGMFLTRPVLANSWNVSPDTTSVGDGNVSYKVITLSTTNLALTQHLFGDVRSCRYGVDIPVGSVDGNVSHGALCRRAHGHELMDVFVCYDDMVGHAGLIRVHKKDATKSNLIIYTMDRCFGG